MTSRRRVDTCPDRRRIGRRAGARTWIDHRPADRRRSTCRYRTRPRSVAAGRRRNDAAGVAEVADVGEEVDDDVCNRGRRVMPAERDDVSVEST